MNAVIDVTNVTLKTKRLTLRHWRQSDLDDLFEYASVDGVGQMVGWLPHKTKEESQKILDFFKASKKIFCVEYNGKAIGSFTIEDARETYLQEISDYKIRELGFVIGKPYWGQGLMAEAVEEVLRYLFEECDVDVVVFPYFTWNLRAGKLMKKCHFDLYQKIRVTTLISGEETIVQGLYWKEDWEDRHGK